jgi:hypothetical protein
MHYANQEFRTAIREYVKVTIFPPSPSQGPC